jgi:hypothetical protein
MLGLCRCILYEGPNVLNLNLTIQLPFTTQATAIPLWLFYLIFCFSAATRQDVNGQAAITPYLDKGIPRH